MSKRMASTCFTGSNAKNPQLQKYIQYLNKENDCHFDTSYLISNSNSTELLKYLNIIKKRYSSLVKYSLKSRYKFNLESSCKKFWQSII